MCESREEGGEGLCAEAGFDQIQDVTRQTLVVLAQMGKQPKHLSIVQRVCKQMPNKPVNCNKVDSTTVENN